MQREWNAVEPFDGDGLDEHAYLRSVNRIATSRWLLANGDTTRAQRLLHWHEGCCDGWFGLAGATFAPIAYLMLGQIEEARGHDEVARAYYHQVLQRYDMPMPALRQIVTDAEAGLARLEGERAEEVVGRESGEP